MFLSAATAVVMAQSPAATIAVSTVHFDSISVQAAGAGSRLSQKIQGQLADQVRVHPV